MTLSIYCSGSIMKGTSDEKKLCWSDLERDQVQKGAGSNRVVFLNPDDPITDPSNTLGQFGRDMYQIMAATAIVVDARERRGIGIGVEMAAAAAMGTPVIVVAPRNSKYRSDVLEYRGVEVKDYVHPHVASLAVGVVDNFIDAGRLLVTLKESADRRRAVPAWLEPAISEYEVNVLSNDAPMVEAMRELGLRD
jgi:glycosyltransferase involved in cell wall biosynthesis